MNFTMDPIWDTKKTEPFLNNLATVSDFWLHVYKRLTVFRESVSENKNILFAPLDMSALVKSIQRSSKGW